MPEAPDLSEDVRSIKDAVARVRNERQQLHLIVRACSLAIGRGACSVWLANQDGSLLELAASYGYDHNYEEFIRKDRIPPCYALGGSGKIGVTGWIFVKQRPFHTSVWEDFKKCKEYAGGTYDNVFWDLPATKRAQSFYGTSIPSINPKAARGVLKIEHRDPGRLDQFKDQDLIEVIAATLSSLLDTSRIDALAKVLELFPRDAREPLGHSVYDGIADVCRQMTGAEACSLFILEPNLGRLVMRGDAGHDNSLVWGQGPDTDTLENTYGLLREPNQKPGLTWAVLSDDSGVVVIKSHEELAKKKDIWAGRLWRKQWETKSKKLHSLYMRRLGTKAQPIGVLKVENKLGPNNQAKGQRFSLADHRILDAFSRVLESAIVLRESTREEVLPWQYFDMYGNQVLLKIYDPDQPDINRRIADTGLAGYGIHQEFHDEVRRLAARLNTPSALAEPLLTIPTTIKDGLLPKLGIPGELAGLLSNLAEAEDILLFRQQHYRDHVIHALNVFMLGYAILINLPKQRVQTMQSTLDEVFRKKRGAAVNILQAWTLAALFHDVGEPVQRAHDWLAAYLEDVFNVPDEMRRDEGGTLIRSLVRLDIIHRYQYSEHLAWTLEAVTTCLRSRHRKEIHDAIMSAFDENFSHGPISSILVLDRLLACKARVNWATRRAAVSAIALHDKKVWTSIEVDWINCDDDENFRKLSLWNQPLAFLLMYCDNAQEYGRAYVDPRNLKKTMEGIPRVDHLHIDDGRVSCGLLYDDPGQELIEQIAAVYNGLDESWESYDEDGLCFELKSRKPSDSIKDISFVARPSRPAGEPRS